MTEEQDWFQREPAEGFTLEMLRDYKPKTVEELAEWLMIAARNLVDADGRRVLSPVKPYVAWQIARMMQIAKLEVVE